MFSGSLNFEDDEDDGFGPSGSLNFEDDEDDGFGPSETKDLSSIFGSQMKPSMISDEPPSRINKKKTPVEENKTNEWTVSLAKVVSAYKLIENVNTLQGKVGLAVLKHNENEKYKIILYRQRNNILSSKTISELTVLMVKNKYLQFEDDENVFWSILFEKVDWKLFKNLLEKHCVIDEMKEVEVEVPVPTNETKSNILERMANLGHFTPIPKFIPSEDSSDGEIKTKEKPMVHPRKQQSHTKHKTSEMTLVPYNSSNQEVVLSKNSNMESSLYSLDSKVDKILDQMKVLGLGGNNDREDEILLLETKVLDLKKENRQLRVLIREIQTNEDGQKNELIIKELRDSIQMFQQKFAGQENFILNLNEKLIESSKINEESKLETNQIIEKLNSKLILNERLSSDLRKQLDEATNVNLTIKSELLQEIKELKEKPNQSKDIEGKIKEMMNNMYSTLCDHFSEEDSFSQNEILRVLGTTIKNETKLVLSELKNL